MKTFFLLILLALSLAGTVTSGNAVQTLQVTVDRLGIFFDRFADMLEVQGVDQ